MDSEQNKAFSENLILPSKLRGRKKNSICQELIKKYFQCENTDVIDSFAEETRVKFQKLKLPNFEHKIDYDELKTGELYVLEKNLDYYKNLLYVLDNLKDQADLFDESDLKHQKNFDGDSTKQKRVRRTLKELKDLKSNICYFKNCPKSFTTRKALNLHVRKYHSQDQEHKNAEEMIELQKKNPMQYLIKPNKRIQLSNVFNEEYLQKRLLPSEKAQSVACVNEIKYKIKKNSVHLNGKINQFNDNLSTKSMIPYKKSRAKGNNEALLSSFFDKANLMNNNLDFYNEKGRKKNGKTETGKNSKKRIEISDDDSYKPRKSENKRSGKNGQFRKIIKNDNVSDSLPDEIYVSDCSIADNQAIDAEFNSKIYNAFKKDFITSDTNYNTVL